MNSNSHTPLAAKLLIASLLQAILYTGLWLWDEYVASYITLIFPVMMLVILLLTTIADWIEPSRIPKWYYVLMILSIIIPVVVGAVFYWIYEGKIDWIMN